MRSTLRRATSRLRFVGAFACGCALGASSGCRVASDLLPWTHTVAVSPDHRYRAFVRQHLNPDPPDDHLYLGPRPGTAREVMALAPDRDWCREIVWSAPAFNAVPLRRIEIVTSEGGAVLGSQDLATDLVGVTIPWSSGSRIARNSR